LHSNNTESCAASTLSRKAAANVTPAISGINLAGKTGAATVRALDLDTKLRKRALQSRVLPNRVPANLDKGLAVRFAVSTSNVRAPVTNGHGIVTPDAALLTSTRGVDVETV
jgi:hypothetical protein